MHPPNFTGLLDALRDACEALQEYRYTGDKGACARARIHLRKAQSIAESAINGQRCIGPECGNPIEYKGAGRPAVYCGKPCRDRAAYRRKREKAQRSGD